MRLFTNETSTNYNQVENNGWTWNVYIRISAIRVEWWRHEWWWWWRWPTQHWITPPPHPHKKISSGKDANQIKKGNDFKKKKDFLRGEHSKVARASKLLCFFRNSKTRSWYEGEINCVLFPWKVRYFMRTLVFWGLKSAITSFDMGLILPNAMPMAFSLVIDLPVC